MDMRKGRLSWEYDEKSIKIEWSSVDPRATNWQKEFKDISVVSTKFSVFLSTYQHGASSLAFSVV